MKKVHLLRLQIIPLWGLFFLFFLNATAQVGIGNTNPRQAAILDIQGNSSANRNKGIYIPSIDISNLSTLAPISGAADPGLLVWNKNSTTGPGFFYWNGAWIPIDGGKSWKLGGNPGLDPHILGTTDFSLLIFNTQGVNRFQITPGSSDGGRLRAYETGSEQNPIYSWLDNPGTGIFKPVPNTLGFSTSGSERFRIADGNQVHAMSNGSEGSPFYSWGTANNSSTGMFSPSERVLGFSSNGTEKFRIPDAEQVHAMKDGSAALPFYSWGSDTDIGMYRIGTNTLGFSTKATERMRINPNGQIEVNNTGQTLDTRMTFSVYGKPAATNSTALYGYGYGVNGHGVWGVNEDGGRGVTGNSTGNSGVGVYGSNTGGTGVGIRGENFADGIGVYGSSTTGNGVVGSSPALGTGYAVYAIGNTGASGTKSFVIDDPRDPANKILKHFSMESNEVLNVYRGMDTFGSNGSVVVTLPDYYEAINKNASYQLTPVGAAMPNMYIEKEIAGGSFIISGGVPGKKVSWTVTAERNDPYLQQYPENRNVEVDKGEKRGKYLMPQLYGQPEEKSYINLSTEKP